MMNKLQDVVVLRTMSIIGVVAFHAYGMMCASAHFPNLSEYYSDIYYDAIYSNLLAIRLPIFIFISGYLFSHLISRGKYKDPKAFIVNKLHRLVLPYFVFGTIMMLTTQKEPNLLSLFHGHYWHLWFIPLLFWCFMCTYLIQKIPSPSKYKIIIEITLLCVVFVLPFIGTDLPTWFGIDYLVNWWIWFYLGYVIYQYREKVLLTISEYKLHIILIGGYIGFNLIEYTNNEAITFYNRSATMCAVIFFWYIVNMLLRFKSGCWAEHKFFTEINKYSMACSCSTTGFKCI